MHSLIWRRNPSMPDRLRRQKCMPTACSKRRRKLADRYLLASGKTPGSPQLDSFGPNMTLAKELLAKGESDSVLQYLDLCKNFWEGERQQLDDWRDAIRGGKTPDFGAN